MKNIWRCSHNICDVVDNVVNDVSSNVSSMNITKQTNLYLIILV